MKTTSGRIVDQYPHLRDGVERKQMLLRNAIGSARIEGIRPDEAQLQQVVGFKTSKQEAARR